MTHTAVKEMPGEETAEVPDESVASVESGLHRAGMALREELTRHWSRA
jgi:DNA-directed RNA polymerase specialized sigma24 family protein